MRPSRRCWRFKGGGERVGRWRSVFRRCQLGRSLALPEFLEHYPAGSDRASVAALGTDEPPWRTPSAQRDHGKQQDRRYGKPFPSRRFAGGSFPPSVCYSSQFSNLNPGTFSKSRRLAVSSRALLTNDMAAIFKSRSCNSDFGRIKRIESLRTRSIKRCDLECSEKPE